MAPAKTTLKHGTVSSYPDGLHAKNEPTAVRNSSLYKSTAVYKNALQSAIVHSKNPPYKFLGKIPGHNQLSKSPWNSVLRKSTLHKLPQEPMSQCIARVH